MESKKFYFLIGTTLCGPHSAEEMLEFNLPEDTPVKDNNKSDIWNTAGDYDFMSIWESETPQWQKKYDLKLKGSEYVFYYKLNGKKYGPKSAKKMLKLNLPLDTFVTESSLEGKWFNINYFDFKKLSEDEQLIKEEIVSFSNKDKLLGGISMIVGVLATVITYNHAAEGGYYIIATGAIIYGFFKLLKGILGGASYELEYIENNHNSDNHEDVLQPDIIDISMEKVNESYAQLDLSPNATDEEIKKKYRELAKYYHPDLNSKSSVKEEQIEKDRFCEIKEAYDILRKVRNIK
jgi:hypothetical protein